MTAGSMSSRKAATAPATMKDSMGVLRWPHRLSGHDVIWPIDDSMVGTVPGSVDVLKPGPDVLMVGRECEVAVRGPCRMCCMIVSALGRTFLDRTSRSSRRATQHPEASFLDAITWVADAYLAVVIVLERRNEVSESYDEGRVMERLLDADRFFDRGGGTAWFGVADQQRAARTIPAVPEGRATRSAVALGYPVTSTDSRPNPVQGGQKP